MDGQRQSHEVAGPQHTCTHACRSLPPPPPPPHALMHSCVPQPLRLTLTRHLTHACVSQPPPPTPHTTSCMHEYHIPFSPPSSSPPHLCMRNTASSPPPPPIDACMHTTTSSPPGKAQQDLARYTVKSYHYLFPPLPALTDRPTMHEHTLSREAAVPCLHNASFGGRTCACQGPTDVCMPRAPTVPMSCVSSMLGAGGREIEGRASCLLDQCVSQPLVTIKRPTLSRCVLCLDG